MSDSTATRRYVVHPPASRIRIEARTTLHPVVVQTSAVRGHVDLVVDEGGAVRAPPGASWSLEVPGSALRSGNAIIDRETSRRVNWHRHPYVRGESVEVVAAGDGDGGTLEVTGDVHFHGVRHRMTGTVEVVPAEGDSLAIRGAELFDVRVFGLSPPRLLVLRVEPVVTVSIDLRVVPAA